MTGVNMKRVSLASLVVLAIMLMASTPTHRGSISPLDTMVVDFGASSAPPVAGTDHGKLYYDAALDQLLLSVNGGAFTAIGGGPGGSLPAGTTAGALLAWDGVSAWVETTATVVSGDLLVPGGDINLGTTAVGATIESLLTTSSPGAVAIEFQSSLTNGAGKQTPFAFWSTVDYDLGDDLFSVSDSNHLLTFSGDGMLSTTGDATFGGDVVATGAPFASGAVNTTSYGGTGIRIEGSDDGNEGFISFADPNADWTLDVGTAGVLTMPSHVVATGAPFASGAASTTSYGGTGIRIEGGNDANEGFISFASPSTDWTWTADDTGLLTVPALLSTASVDATGDVSGANISATTGAVLSGTYVDATTYVQAGSDVIAVGFVYDEGVVVRTATQTVTDSTTLVADNTLIVDVVNTHKYGFLVEYWFTTTATTAGAKADMGGGTATFSSFQGDGVLTNLSTFAALAGNELTASTTTAGFTATGAVTKVVLQGSFTASANGTVIPRFAQNAETGAGESIVAKVGSRMKVWRMP